VSERRVFLDSSFWVCLRDEREVNHDRAVAVARGLLRQRLRFVITPLVFAETHAYFSRASRRRQQVLDDFEHNPIIACEPLTGPDQSEAIRLLRLHRDKTYSFCDAVSFVLMRRLGVKQAASFDDHFRQFGECEVIC
jgi:uncharacterized protein